MKNNIREKIVFLIVLSAIALNGFSASSSIIYNIQKFGAKGNDRTINTSYINEAIEICEKQGGGTVIIPPGIFITGTIHLKSNVNLYLEKGAVIKGISDINAYQSYKPTKNLDKFNSIGDDSKSNANSTSDENWIKTLVLGVGIQNVTISGEGIIDGNHVFNPIGEENMRGPHTIIIAESRNISLSNFTINKAANYAFLGYDIENVIFQNMTINEGWDGIHIRGGKNIIIRNCNFFTGDDAIAGGFWENMVITNCYINSSCDGIRVIMPVNGMDISYCQFMGPGKYPHLTSGVKKRTNTLSAILLQPGGWGGAPGDLKNIHIHDLEMDNLANPFMFVLNEGNNGKDILVEKVIATRINMSALSVESWKGGVFENLTFRDINIQYVGNKDPKLKNILVGQPPNNARLLPCWGFLIRNVQNISFENLNLQYTGEESRSAFYFDNVYNTTFKNVVYKTDPNIESFILINSGKIEKINSK